MKCATHPDIETSLGCATCGRPICPRCMVETPVGMKCRGCARLQRLPVFRVSARHYLQALGAGLGSAAAFGFAWAVFRVFVPFSGFFGFFMALGVGYGTGELVYIAARHKRGPWLAAIAGASVVISSFLSLIVFPQLISPFRFAPGIFDLLSVVAGVVVAVTVVR